MILKFKCLHHFSQRLNFILSFVSPSIPETHFLKDYFYISVLLILLYLLMSFIWL